MIKDNQKVFNRLLVIIDALITAVSFVLAYYIKFYILNDGPGIGVLPVQDYYMLLPFIVPGYMFLYYRCSVYSPKRTVRRRHDIQYPAGEYHWPGGFDHYFVYDHP